jgi:hypothetical protein
MDPAALARQLVALAHEVSAADIAYPLEDQDDGDWSELPGDQAEQHNMTHHAGELVDALARALDQQGWAPDDVGATEVRSLGRWTQRARPRRIVGLSDPWGYWSGSGGFLEPLRQRPLVARVPAPVVLYLIRELPGGKDALEREKHGVGKGMGWHYHYLDRWHRRSNVILSWDTRWSSYDPKAERPLFVEPHAEGKAEFQARPYQWMEPKRRSMHALCAKDLTRPMSEFRPASNSADPVWPLGMRMTPPEAPLPPPTAKPKHPAKPKRR